MRLKNCCLFVIDALAVGECLTEKCLLQRLSVRSTFFVAMCVATLMYFSDPVVQHVTQQLKVVRCFPAVVALSLVGGTSNNNNNSSTLRATSAVASLQQQQSTQITASLNSWQDALRSEQSFVSAVSCTNVDTVATWLTSAPWISASRALATLLGTNRHTSNTTLQRLCLRHLERLKHLHELRDTYVVTAQSAAITMHLLEECSRQKQRRVAANSASEIRNDDEIHRPRSCQLAMELATNLQNRWQLCMAIFHHLICVSPAEKHHISKTVDDFTDAILALTAAVHAVNHSQLPKEKQRHYLEAIANEYLRLRGDANRSGLSHVVLPHVSFRRGGHVIKYARLDPGESCRLAVEQLQLVWRKEQFLLLLPVFFFLCFFFVLFYISCNVDFCCVQKF